MTIAALVAWILTAAGGFVLLAKWISHGGIQSPGTSRFPQPRQPLALADPTQARGLSGGARVSASALGASISAGQVRALRLMAGGRPHQDTDADPWPRAATATPIAVRGRSCA